MHFDVIDQCSGIGNWVAVLDEALKVKLDRRAKSGQGLLDRFAGGDTSGEIGHVCGIIAFGFLKYDGVAHESPLPEPGLSKNAVEGSNSYIITWVSGHRDSASFGRMLVLTMASALGNQMPAVSFDDPQHLAHFHGFHSTQRGGTTQNRESFASVASPGIRGAQ